MKVKAMNAANKGFPKIIVAASTVVVMIGCVPAKFGGMTRSEAFSDPHVASLVEAVNRGDYAEADRQRALGADVNAVGKDGISPLLWVMGTTLNAGRMEYLLKAGANPNYRNEKEKRSAMNLAAGGNRFDLLEILIKYKGNPNLLGPSPIDDDEEVPLLVVAVVEDRDKMIKFLVENGADINWSGKGGRTAANKALISGRFDLIAYFLEHGLTAHLQRLAREAAGRDVPKDSKNYVWKEKVLTMLKQRGVDVP